jgi:isopenicillin-N epimerase
MFGLQNQFLLDPSVTFLNHGSFGAVPRPVFKIYQRWQRELENQPVEFLGRRFQGLMQNARHSLAEYLGTKADNVVFTTNVTEALNIVVHSLNLGPEDEVLSTNHEYGAIDRTWKFYAQERGFAYIIQPIPVPVTTTQEFIDELWKGVTPQTRVIFLSHITSPTALVFPVEQVVWRAHQSGILVVIDGAHAPGQIPLRLDELGADFYAGNLHKWLCAPKGAGFLYAKPNVQHMLKPLVVSWGYDAEIPGPSKFIDHHEWTGTRDIAAFLSVSSAIEFQNVNDWENVRSRCHALVQETLAQICALSGFSPLSDGSWFMQFATAQLPDTTDLGKLKNYLYEEYRIEIPLILWNGCKLIRLSIQGYNSLQDVRKLNKALEVYFSLSND